MVHDVVLVQRLLDQQQVELVQLAEGRRVGERVGAVGVDLQRHFGPALADSADHVHVPAGLDLELDAAIPLGDVLGHPVEQRIERRLDADAHADRDEVLLAAQELGQRRTLRLRQQVPHRILQPGPGHRVATHPPEARHHVRGRRHLLAQHGRDEKVAQHVPGGLDRLARVPRPGPGGALAPAGEPSGVDSHQDAGTGQFAPKAGLEGIRQRHIHVVHFDAFDFHRTVQSFSSR